MTRNWMHDLIIIVGSVMFFVGAVVGRESRAPALDRAVHAMVQCSEAMLAARVAVNRANDALALRIVQLTGAD